MQTGQVFFSYSRVDADFALKLASDLRAAGIDVWIDQIDIRPSEPWDEEIEKALEMTGCLLVIISDTSVASDNVLNEIAFALESKKQVLPVVIEKNIKKPLNIRRLQHIDFTGPYDSAFNQLLKALRSGKPVLENTKDDGKAIPIAIIAIVIVLIAALVKVSFDKPGEGQAYTSVKKENEVSITSNSSKLIAGKWYSEELANPFDNNDRYRIYIDLELFGKSLVGSINLVSATDNNSYNIKKGIVDGKFNDSTISFHTIEQSIVGTENVTFKNIYNGLLENEEIRFTLQSDRPWGFPGQQFIAKRGVPGIPDE